MKEEKGLTNSNWSALNLVARKKRFKLGDLQTFTSTDALGNKRIANSIFLSFDSHFSAPDPKCRLDWQQGGVLKGNTGADSKGTISIFFRFSPAWAPMTRISIFSRPLRRQDQGFHYLTLFETPFKVIHIVCGAISRWWSRTRRKVPSDAEQSVEHCVFQRCLIVGRETFRPSVPNSLFLCFCFVRVVPWPVRTGTVAHRLGLSCSPPRPGGQQQAGKKELPATLSWFEVLRQYE